MMIRILKDIWSEETNQRAASLLARKGEVLNVMNTYYEVARDGIFIVVQSDCEVVTP